MQDNITFISHRKALNDKDVLAILGIKFYFQVILTGIPYEVGFTQKKIISLLGINEHIWRKHYNTLLAEFRRENHIE